jgi:hypothetical protein
MPSWKTTWSPATAAKDSIMQRAGVPLLYDLASNPHCPASTSALSPTCWGAPPSFRVSSAAKVTPLFHTASWTIGVLEAPLPTHIGTGPGGNGIRLYEVNIWMWRYGPGRPQMVSIAEAERIRSKRISESRTRRGSNTARPLLQPALPRVAADSSKHWS